MQAAVQEGGVQRGPTDPQPCMGSGKGWCAVPFLYSGWLVTLTVLCLLYAPRRAGQEVKHLCE